MSTKRRTSDFIILGFLAVAIVASVFFFSQSVTGPEEGEEISEKSFENDEVETFADDPPRISSEDLRDLMENNEKVTVINPESRENFFKKHIPGTVSFPNDEVAANLPELPRDHTIVVTSSGSEAGCNLSIRIARLLASEGFPDVRDHHDGWAGWEKYGFPTATNNAIDVPQVSVSDVQNYIDDSEEMIVVDLRDDVAFSESSVPGAKNIPFYEFAERKEEIPHNTLIILYDKDGIKSNLIGKELLSDKYVTVKSMVGGFDKWSLQNS